MRRTILIVLMMILVPMATFAHEGMLALVADPVMLDCDDGIQPGTLVNLYLYYFRGSDGPDNHGCAQLKLLCSTDGVFVLDPDWLDPSMPLGDVTEGIALCLTDGEYRCDDDQVFFGTIPIFNFSDTDTFTISVVDAVINEHPAPLAIVDCNSPRQEVRVSGNSYTFNGKCRKKDDSPEVLGADAVDPRTVTVSFNEEISVASASELASYTLIRAGEPDAVIALGSAALMADGQTVELHLDEDLVEMGDYSIFIDGVADIDGNSVVPGEPYSYAVFTAPQVATLLQCFSASLEGNAVRVRWELSEYNEGEEFIVSRGNGENEVEADLFGMDIFREGLEFGFLDTGIEAGEEYKYRVDVVSEGERKTLFATGAVRVPVSPAALHQNTPNPFNPVTMISYYIPVAGEVKITVFDVAGRLVKTLVSGICSSGEHTVEWNGSTDSQGQAVSGIYFYMLEYEKESITRKMVLLR